MKRRRQIHALARGGFCRFSAAIDRRGGNFYPFDPSEPSAFRREASGIPHLVITEILHDFI
jgi:hypothetical protein